MRKIGQMKIQQMAFMLIAVTLFFVFVGMFFLTFVFSDIKKSANLIEEKNALFLVSKLANSPEFSCGNSFDGFKANCIDSDKVMVLKGHETTYLGFWGVEKISVRKIYPSGNSVECSLGNYPNCNEIIILGTFGEDVSGVGVSNFVALCRKDNIEGIIDNKCEMAKVIVYYGE
ncbi:MAG: hypothetical protein KJ905_03625 [Nanoarchaeota archaeon]|nr:hypothetical protein [Nanoarchaeota archaeon]MBU1501830.1 hypothetical protein [Nanoarchaeota archaeon]MBU2459359.1 hypothetical protein [Nanoarchaeota archaeon]